MLWYSLRIVLGLSAMWASHWLQVDARSLVDEATGPDDIGKPVLGDLQIPSKPKEDESAKKDQRTPAQKFLDALNKDDEPQTLRRIAYEGDRNWFGEDPAVTFARPENQEKLAMAAEHEIYAMVLGWVGVALFLSGFIPALRRLFFKNKPEGDSDGKLVPVDVPPPEKKAPGPDGQAAVGVDAAGPVHDSQSS
jgi:hypothetical protein